MTQDDWIKDVRGCPWVDRADGPDAYDCWGLVLDYARRVLGRELPAVRGYKTGECSFQSGMMELLDCGSLISVEEPFAFMFTAFIGDEPTHVGVVIGNKLVHALGTRSGGQVYVHTINQARKIFKGSKLEFWQCL